MHRVLAAIVLIPLVSCVSRVAHGDAEPFTEQDAARHARLQELFWLPGLSGEQVEFVADALDDSNTQVLEAAIDNVFLHRPADLTSKLEEGVGQPSMHVRILGQMSAESIEAGKGASAQLRAGAWRPMRSPS